MSVHPSRLAHAVDTLLSLDPDQQRDLLERRFSTTGHPPLITPWHGLVLALPEPVARNTLGSSEVDGPNTADDQPG